LANPAHSDYIPGQTETQNNLVKEYDIQVCFSAVVLIPRSNILTQSTTNFSSVKLLLHTFIYIHVLGVFPSFVKTSKPKKSEIYSEESVEIQRCL